MKKNIRGLDEAGKASNAWLQRRGANPHKLRRSKYHRKDATAASAASRSWAATREEGSRGERVNIINWGIVAHDESNPNLLGCDLQSSIKVLSLQQTVIQQCIESERRNWFTPRISTHNRSTRAAQRLPSAARREPTQATSQEIPWKGCYRRVRCKPLLDRVRA